MNKEKIGIVTLEHVRNIGAVLQAYSLKRTVEKMGYEPIFFKAYGLVDSLVFFKSDMGGIRPCNLLFLIKKNIKFVASFKNFDERNISNKNLEQCKTIILGSDSIWVPKNGKRDMPLPFFGNIRHFRIGSYAASSGGMTELDKYSDEQKKSLCNIKYFTVRDTYTQKLINDITGIDAKIVLDPTLLINWREEIKLVSEVDNLITYGKYIAVYGGFSNRMFSAIKKIAEEKKCRILNIGSYDKRFKENIAVSPFEFLNYINNAELVITSMFHGVMISLGLRKKFIYMSNDGNRTRKLSSQMKALGFKDQDWVYDQEQLSLNSSCIYPIDFENKLKNMQEQSLRYLELMIQGEM